MENKPTIVISIVAIVAIGILVFLGLKSQKESAGGITVPSYFRQVGNTISITNNALDFAVGNSSSSSADFAVDPGNNLTTINNLTVTGTCTGCGTGGGGGTQIEIGTGSGDGGFLTSSVSFSPSGFNVTDKTGWALVDIDYTNGPASRSLSQTWMGIPYFSVGASFSGTTKFKSSDVTSALTFTPYNATNPSGYIAGADVPANETDATHDTCAEITGCVQNAIVLGSLSASSPITYNNGTGAFSITSGFTVPVTASVSAWEGFYDTPSSRISVANNLAWSTNTLGVATNYSIPLTASISAHETFYDTPSNRITPGTNLSWAGNTLNATGGGSVTSNSLNFDEFQNPLVADTDITFTGGAYAFTFDHASVSGDFEVLGFASASAFYQNGIGLVPYTGATDNVDLGGYGLWTGPENVDPDIGGFVFGHDAVTSDYNGGNLFFSGGAGLDEGNGGNLLFDGGVGGVAGNGGNLTFRAGNGGDYGNGGLLTFKAGSGGVAKGQIRFYGGGTGMSAGVLNFDSLSDERIFTFPDLTGTLLLADTTQNLELSGTASISNALWTTGGNVGIGTTSPTTKLDVIGNASVSLNFEVGGMIYGNLTGAVTGNASTATALAANGANCNAGEYPLGVNASGAVENCTDATTEINTIVGNYLPLAGGTLTGTLIGTNASLSGNLEVSGTASVSAIVGQNTFRGFGLTDCDTAATSKLLWDTTTGMFSCGTDQGGTQIEIGTGQGNGGFLTSSVSFSPSGFNVTDKTGWALVDIDYTNGPASKALANTWSGLQDFNAGASVSGGTFEVSKPASMSATSFSGATTGIALNEIETPTANVSWNLANGRTISITANDTTPTVGEGVINLTAIGAFADDFLHVHQHTGNAAAGAMLMHLESVDTDILPLRIEGTNQFAIRASQSMYLEEDMFVGRNASVSGNLELTASGQISGAGLADCDAAGAVLNWDTTTRLFSCHTIADADVPNTLSMTGTWATTGDLTIGDGGDDVIINSDTWDVSSLGAMTGLTGIVSTGLASFVNASASGNFEISGKASVSNALWTTGGNVGIGTTSPATKLDVWGNLNVATSSTPALFVNTATTRVGIGTSSPIATLAIQGTAGSTNPFTIASSTGSTLLTVTPAGNVGIGTAGPTAKLHTVQSADLQLATFESSVANSIADGQTVLIKGSNNNTETAYFQNRAPGLLIQNTNGTANTYGILSFLDAGGNSVAALMGYYQDDANNQGALGLWTRPSGGSITERMQITSDGNVGIGTSSPTTKLDVSGNASVSLNFEVGGMIYGNLTGAVTGNASTATALAANGANCNAGEYPLGVNASGAVENCTDATTEIDSAITTHTSNASAHHALVTLAGAPNYLTLSGQQITLTKLDISDDTNMTAGTDLTLTANDLTLDPTLTQAFTFSNTGSQSMTGSLDVAKGLNVGSGNLRVTTGGNVGIGTTGPGYKLDVAGDGRFTGGLNVNTSGASTGQIFVSTGLAFDDRTLGTSRRWEWFADNDIARLYSVIDGTSHLVIKQAGNVGIGTAGPETKLEIVGTASASAFYATGDVSALTFTDRTPGFEGDALFELSKIKSIDGQIDHKSLPDFMKSNIQIPIYESIKVEDEKGSVSYEDKFVGYRTEEGRNLGNTVTLLVKAVQEQQEQIDALEKRVALLDGKEPVGAITPKMEVSFWVKLWEFIINLFK